MGVAKKKIAEPNTGHLKVLIADDDAVSRLRLQKLVASWDYAVVAAQDGNEALEILKSEDGPKLAVLDWMMPGMDGIDVVREVRKFRRGSPPYLILLTSLNSTDDTVRGLEAGANDYIKKPFKPQEFHARLEAGCRIVQLQTALDERISDAEKTLQERKLLEIELRHAQKLEAVGSLAAGIAHELNTPIQFVGDNTRFLQESFGAMQRLIAKYRELYAAVVSGEVSQEMIESVKQTEEAEEADYLREEVPAAFTQTLDGVNRVATIVRAMKEFAHPAQAEKSAADLKKALSNTLIVARNEIKYVADVATDLGEIPSVLCNLGDINQVFLNLLVNAAHAIADAVKETGGRGLITVRTRQEDDRVVISFSDTGCGIPPHIRNRIFEPFFTTKEVGRGTGQGLAIARSIVVDKHGGNLTFESEVGKGTTFFIRLPINPAPQEEQPR